MQLGISSSYLAEWPLEAMVRELAEHGWHAAELHDTHARQLFSGDDPFLAGQRFGEMATQEGISFPQGHLVSTIDDPVNPWFDIAPDDHVAYSAALDEMRRWLDLYAGVGIPCAILHMGGWRLVEKGWSQERAFARRVEALARLADHLDGSPTTICIENLGFPSSGVQTLDEITAFLSAVDSDNVAICLDTGHAHMVGADIPAFVRGAGPLLQALHINDNLGGDDIHLLPYSGGTIEWEPVLDTLRQTGYAGAFNLEITGENRCPKPVRLAKLDYARELAKWMADQLRCPPYS